MKVKVLLFGRLVTIAGSPSIEITPEGRESSVEVIREIIFDRFPRMEKEIFRIVVNQEICSGGQMVREGDVIAFLPPISGGAHSYLTRGKITPDYVKEILSLNDPSCGSVLTFEGRVRRDEDSLTAGRHIEEIEYSAYEEMAEREMGKIVNSVREKFKLGYIAVKHVIGRVKVGEISFFAAVFSSHRKEGIAAIDYIIDQVKNKVPIWKKEIYSDGAEKWQEGVIIE